MFEEIRNIKSGKRELRQFGITVGTVLSLLGGLFFLRQKDYYFYFLILSGTFISFGIVAPIALKSVQKIWMGLAILVGLFVTRIILIVLFYFVFTPTRILAKIFGKSFLDVKFDKIADSYWIPRESTKFDKKSYEKQF